MGSAKPLWKILLTSFLWAARTDGQPTSGMPLHSDLCGTRDLTPFERRLDQVRMSSLFKYNQGGDETHQRQVLLGPSCDELCKHCIEIDVYFHLSGYRFDHRNTSSPWVIPHPTTEFQLLQEELNNRTDKTIFPDIEPGRFSTVEDVYQLIEVQMVVLNTHYADTPFRFRWVNNDASKTKVGIQNHFVFFFAGDLFKSNEYATVMHQGDKRTLNIYLNYRICGHPFIWRDANCKTIGAATNPSYQADGTSDGVYLSYDTLAGGGYQNYDTGLSLVHEIGHWLGLLHVFETETTPSESGSSDKRDPCDSINEINGDFVDDTPFIPNPSVLMYRCSLSFYADEEIPNSCPNLPGVDPVFNIMNYVGSELCLAEGHAHFTCGQIERMYKQWMLYREHNEDCASDEMKLNMKMELDTRAHDVHAEITRLYSDKPIFTMGRDMDLSLFPEQASNASRNINFCLPKGDYVLAVTDLGRDGFEDGFMELSVNGNVLHRVEGNFGSTECLLFNENGPAAESRNGVESIGGYFGERYRYDVDQGQNMTLSCAADEGPFLVEPIPIMDGRYMRVAVSMSNAGVGICINDVLSLDISSDGSETTVFPRDDDYTIRYQSEVISCGGHTCIVQFDLARLQGIHSAKNRAGVYSTSCKATVKIGYGEACDNYLKEGGVDCSLHQREVFSSAEGQILFSMPVASPAKISRGLTPGLLMIAGSSALLMLW